MTETPAREMIDQLRRTLGRMEIALAEVDDCIAWTDAKGAVQWCNTAFDRLVGRTHLELLGIPLVDLLPLRKAGERLPAEAHPVTLALARLERSRGMYELLSGAESLHLEIVVAPVKFIERDASIVVTLRDLTERLRDEQELRELVRALQVSNEELEQFAHSASHDLREPLRAIGSFAQILMARHGASFPPEEQGYLREIVEGAARMNRLLRDLVEYARAAQSDVPMNPARLDACLAHAVTSLRAAIEQSRAQITHEPLPVVVGSASELARVFQNLIENSIKFRGTEAPSIHVSSERAGAECTVTVRDNGIGIPESYRQLVFGLFKRLHTRTRYPGTGLGLAICKRIIERHGGRIWVEPAEGPGTMLRFSLPVSGKAE